MSEAPTCAAAPSAWPIYLSCQHFADPEVLNSRALGHDEQLAEIIDRIATGSPISQDSIAGLDRNRARKYRNQQKLLLEKIARWDAVAENREIAFENAVTNERLDWVRKNTTRFEWRCLWLLAKGHTYDEVSAQVLLKPSTLRSCVSRCRTRLREASVVA